ncbi:6-hydroxymethylpterin diphosphokinase MptE-like protein [Pollutimonas sp. H1-120]|uniref:6-hydroxymethylpterin diphosphokinase MptE-like protein n=1 Tax=Pollutimonas sp. H1-120 TaxID=3148824 RepID=UPI003B52BCA7
MSKFAIKENIDKLIYGTYNFVSEIAYSLDNRSKKIIKKNKNFKDIHVGNRCFIAGTGPSLNTLTDENLKSLNKEILFGVNSLYKSRIGSKLSPQYYTLIDNLYWEQWDCTFSEVSSKYSQRPPIFITDVRAKHLLDGLDENIRAIYIHSKKYPVKKMSAELDKNVYAAMNVVAYSILTAMYMGFSEIYLLGCDYNAFCTAGKGHCYDDEEEISGFNYNLAFYLKFYWITTEFHYLIAKLAKEKQIKVINVTPDSLLDAYPRMSLANVL